MSAEQSEYLTQLLELFGNKSQVSFDTTTDRIRLVADAIQSWQTALPQVAHSFCFQKDHLAGQALVLLKSQNKPIEVLFEELPKLFGTVNDYKQTLEALSLAKTELENSFETYLVQVTQALNAIFDAHCEATLPLSAKRKNWLALFNLEFVDGITDGLAKRFLSTLGNQALTDDLLLEQLAGLLVGRALKKWEDSHVIAFESQLHNVVSRIEAAYVTWTQGKELGSEDERAKMLFQRISSMAQRLEEIVGKESSRAALAKLLS
jgi:hypothetical protein